MPRKDGNAAEDEMTWGSSGERRVPSTDRGTRLRVPSIARGPVEGTLRLELDRALAVADRANNAAIEEHDGRWIVQGDPTEGALLVAARKAGLEPDTLDEQLPRVGEVPFSSERKLMSTLHRDAQRADRGIVFTKGAQDVLLGSGARRSWWGKSADR